MEARDMLLARLRQRLAEDPRTNVLDPELDLRDGVLHVSGEVDSEATMAAVEEVALEMIPHGMRIVNRLWIVSYTAPNEAEDLV